MFLGLCASCLFRLLCFALCLAQRLPMCSSGLTFFSISRSATLISITNQTYSRLRTREIMVTFGFKHIIQAVMKPSCFMLLTYKQESGPGALLGSPSSPMGWSSANSCAQSCRCQENVENRMLITCEDVENTDCSVFSIGLFRTIPYFDRTSWDPLFDIS